MANTLIDQLQKIDLFANLSKYDLQFIEKYLSFNKIDAGDYVFTEGQRGDFVCFVVHGHLEVLKNNKNGTTVKLHMLCVGDTIGEMAIIDKLTRSASIRAIQTSALIYLYRRDFNIILQEHPEIGIKILKNIASLLSLNLRRTSERLAEQI